MYFYRYFFHLIVLSSIISIIATLSIENTHNDANQESRQKVQVTSITKRSREQDEKFHKADKDQLPSKHTQTYLLTMLPVAKGDHVFNSDGEQEWEVQRDTPTQFAIYGENLDGAQLSFTTHPESCQWERKNKIYTLQVDATDPHERMSERAFIDLTLPYYNSTLYMCLTPTNSNEVFHQGNRPALKIRVTRRALPVWATILSLICLLSLSGLFSGLNLGLMSLTPHDLIVIQEAGTVNDRKYAKQIYPVRKHGNFLLCTILLGNVLVNSTTTILLDTLISGGLAVASATLAIVIFGEIIPQAICSRHGLKVGSRTIRLTQFFMVATFPISYPLSKLLDIILGEEVGARYTRDQMSALLKHTQTTDIEDREKLIMTGVLSLKGKKIRDIMTNLIDVFMLEANRIVDDELVLNVHGYGYSRIPVYEGRRDNIIGLVNIRDFALLDTESGKFTVRNIMNFYKHRYGTAITSDDSSYDVFNLFKKEQYHLGVVVEYDNTSEKDPKAKSVGIVTLEDIIEEMIQEEIIDETDVFTDNRRKVRNMLSQAPDFSAFIRTTTNAVASKISAQMKVAVFQFLSTSVEPFRDKFISAHILSRLLNVDLYKEFEFDEDDAKVGKTTYIYEYGKPVDYFVLIVNGKAELETGKEKIVSEVGSFSYFGVSALYNPDEKVDELIRLKSNKFRPFIPDFSVRVSEDVQILRIRRVHWLAAVRATYFENRQTANGGALMLNSDGEQIDLLTQELEMADHVDPITTTGSISGAVGQDGVTGGGSIRERTSSLAPTIASDGGVTLIEQERILAQNQALANLSNIAKVPTDSPNTSGRNTPTLTVKQKRQLFRSEVTTSTSPPSLTGGSSSSKNRSLT
ncbi:unnamed protein product [Rotaria sp. Silwood2]|nr:unnamed protein product [Rotaria sp. Silwood2]CAF2652174.1 unnamed protein product [Rotaria sp. Silwood2]CAF2725260.1 unnamed protein product [Rotaria sp. Silwood2]CAF4092508.1 unnamed protein product [Rotaria sp. Silwood2]CAF4120177.1 unnamed protein product [Rotaria sp. Silwood2]